MKTRILKTLFLLAALSIAGCGYNGGKTPEGVKVTSIKLNKEAVTIPVGGSEQLSVIEVLPADAEDQSVTWSSDAPARATVDDTGLITFPGTATEGTVNIIATANDGSGTTASCAVTVSGVLINGVAWATRNVDEFGTFATSAESTGMFYQWNRAKAWPVTGEVTDWDSTPEPGDEWEADRDPCPGGYRIPSTDQLGALIDSDKVSNEWVDNNMKGRKFVDKTSGFSIFLPAVGCRVEDGEPLEYGEYAYYWSALGFPGDTRYAWMLPFSQAGVGVVSASWRYFGFTVRCVLE